MCPIGTVTFRLTAWVPPSPPWQRPFDKKIILLALAIAMAIMARILVTLATLHWLICWWWGCQAWYPPSIVSPQSPLLAQSKSLEKGRARSPQRRQSPSLCSSVKSTRQFLHLFELATNKQTDFNSSLLSRLPICHYTFMVQGWITGMSKSSVFLEYK